MIKTLLAALALTTALSLSAAEAMAKPVTFSTAIRDYGGNNAYLAMYVTDQSGAYAGTLWLAGSRSRWISPGKTTDNYGFAGWVTDHAHELVDLGPGRHYGEWWGNGIQRGYGLAEKRFSLFNVHRWADEASRPSCVGVVPVLFEGEFSTYAACEAVTRLRMDGSRAAPDFAKPEGIIVYHTAQQSLFKMTLERDAEPKSLAA